MKKMFLKVNQNIIFFNKSFNITFLSYVTFLGITLTILFHYFNSEHEKKILTKIISE